MLKVILMIKFRKLFADSFGLLIDWFKCGTSKLQSERTHSTAPTIAVHTLDTPM